MSFVNVYANVLRDMRLSEKEVNEVLNALIEVCSSKVAVDFYCSPLFSFEDKLSTVKKALGKEKVSEQLINFMTVLLKNKRLHYIKDIAKEYRSQADKEKSIVRGSVYTASDISKEELSELQDVVKKIISAKEVILDLVKDSDLIQDVRVEVGGYVIDSTLIRKYKNLETKLKKQTL